MTGFISTSVQSILSYEIASLRMTSFDTTNDNYHEHDIYI